MTRRDDPPGALPAHRGAAHHQAHRDDPVGEDPGSEAGRIAGPDLPRQAMADLVAAATMAPSMHNTQPWRFRFQPASQTIGLYADPARMLRFGDPDGRALHIACGAALFNLRLAASRCSGCFLTLASRYCSPRCGWPGGAGRSRLSWNCTRLSQRVVPTGARSAASRYRRVCSPNWLGQRG